MKRQKIGGPPAGEPWCWSSLEMLISPAFREMSVNCIRFINALEVEHMNHAGTENGNLIMPYNQLQRDWRIPRRLIRRTIEEAARRGLIEERRGLRLGYAKAAPTRFRLTFRPTREGNPPQWRAATNEWRSYRASENKNRSKGSAMAPTKCHKVHRTRLLSVPLRELAVVPHETPLSISREEGGRGAGGVDAEALSRGARGSRARYSVNGQGVLDNSNLSASPLKLILDPVPRGTTSTDRGKH